MNSHLAVIVKPASVEGYSMRFDKLTTKFQQAFADAQSLALGHDNPAIEPQHLLLALLNDSDSGAGALLAGGCARRVSRP